MKSKHVDYLSLAEILGIEGRISGRQYYALCPLHDERGPSFSLNLNSGGWTCHKGCGPKKGRSFTMLVMLVRDCSMASAKAWIEKNHKYPDNDTLRASIEGKLAQKTSAPDLEHETLLRIAEDHWSHLPANVMALPLLQRGFDWDDIQRWGIRFDEQNQALVIPALDFTNESKWMGAIWRNFDEGKPKYQNSPGLNRSHFIFGYGRRPQDRAGMIILVEGPLDAIWLQRFGYNAGALLGTALAEPQLKLLQAGNHQDVIMGFDSDAAGNEAATTVADKLTDSGWRLSQVSRIDWTPSKDAQECSEDQIHTVVLNRRKMYT